MPPVRMESKLFLHEKNKDILRQVFIRHYFESFAYINSQQLCDLDMIIFCSVGISTVS